MAPWTPAVMVALVTSTLGTHCPSLPTATAQDVQGPFFKTNAPFRHVLAPANGGSRVKISGVVTDRLCRHIPCALIEVWSADLQGEYEDDNELWGRGRMRSEAGGEYSFETFIPGRYTLGESFRPAHIHIKVSVPGFPAASWTSQIYFAGDPYLGATDPCGAVCNSAAPSLIVPLLMDGVMVPLNTSSPSATAPGDAVVTYEADFPIHLQFDAGSEEAAAGVCQGAQGAPSRTTTPPTTPSTIPATTPTKTGTETPRLSTNTPTPAGNNDSSGVSSQFSSTSSPAATTAMMTGFSLLTTLLR